MKRGEKWFPKNYEQILTWKIFGPSHSRYVLLRQSSRFRARVAKGRPAFRDRITRGKPRVQNCVSRGRCRLRKTVNIFSFYNDRVTWNVAWRTVVSKNLWTNFDLKNIWSQSFSIRTSKGRAPASELVLLRRGLPSEIALQGGSLVSKIVYRGVGADFEKP